MFGTKKKKVISSERQAGVLQGCRKWLDPQGRRYTWLH